MENKINLRKGTLYLIPNLIAETDPDQVLPAYVIRIAKKVHTIFAEDIRNARRFIKKLNPSAHIDHLTFYPIGKHTKPIEIYKQLSGVPEGTDAGIISEAGLPCIADPGAILVAQAHKMGLRVVPLSGPSSITLALIASGFTGQSFVFHGYLPINKKDRGQKIRELEKNAYRLDQTQIFMEAPFRNNQLIQDILSSCSGNTLMCIAANITSSAEYIKTKSISEWKNSVPDLHKQPVIYLLYKSTDYF